MMGKIGKIFRKDLFGIFYVKKSDGLKWKWNSYYETICSLRHLFRDDKFKKLVNGFYLNISGDYDSVRISYFVAKIKVDSAVHIFRKFFENNGLIEIKDCEYPREIDLAKKYGGEEWEEQFRNFLIIETQIGLELLDKDILNSRILFATYIFQLRNAGLPFRQHFEPTFRKYSLAYNTLSDDERNQFFNDFEKWNHLMVNFILGGDSRSGPNKPLSIKEINKYIKELGFQIPLDWRPF